MLSVKNLSISFGQTKALKNLSYTLSEGDTLSIVGESGSGKTISALALMRLLNAEISGQIIFDGRDVLKMSGRELLSYRGAKCGVVFQDPMTALNPVFTVYNQLEEVFLAHKICKKQEVKGRIINIFKEVGLEGEADKIYSYPHEFSGGQRQRILIAMALAAEPKLLILDEPTTALDVTIQAQIISLLKNIQAGRKMSLIFITHNLALAKQMARRVLVLYAGEMMEYAPAEQIFSAPKHPYTKALLNSVLDLKERRAILRVIDGAPPRTGEEFTGCPFAPRCARRMEICSNRHPGIYERGGAHVRCFLYDNITTN